MTGGEGEMRRLSQSVVNVGRASAGFYVHFQSSGSQDAYRLPPQKETREVLHLQCARTCPEAFKRAPLPVS